MQENRQGNHEIDARSVFDGLNQYFLLFFALCCILTSVFVQELFIIIKQFRIGITIAPIIGMFLPIFILTRRFTIGFREQLRIRRMRLVTTIQVLLATLLTVIVVDHIYIISQQFMPAPDGYIEGLKALKPTGPWSMLVTFLGLCLVVPVAEEIVFRGFVQRIFARNMDNVSAFLLAGVFFGVVHLSPQLLLSMVCFGIFLGFVFYATSNLSYAILGHAVLNTVAFAQLSFESGEDLTAAPFYVQQWWYLPVALGIVLIILREIKRGATQRAPAPFDTVDDSEKR
jgi:membrane protease YdiL (CAAX protease family)